MGGIPQLYQGSKYKPMPLVPIPVPVPELPNVASATLLRDWRAGDLTIGATLNTWTSRDSRSHVLTRGAGASGLLVSNVGILNDRNYVALNGSDDWLLNQDCSDLDNLDSFAVFVASDFAPCVVTKMYRTSDGAGWALYATGTSIIIQEAGGNNWIEKDSPNPIIVTGISTMEVVSKSELHLYTNNDNSEETDNSQPPVNDYSTSEPLRVGVFGRMAPFFPGWLFGILIYSPAPNASDRASIVQWMTDNVLGIY